MLGELLFPPAADRRTTASLLIWWESRRMIYNGIVGLAGLFTLLVIRLIAFVPPGVPFPFDWRPIVAYGALANVCYTFGWAIESVAQRMWRQVSDDWTGAFSPRRRVLRRTHAAADSSRVDHLGGARRLVLRFGLRMVGTLSNTN
jgi:hypothetical protein